MNKKIVLGPRPTTAKVEPTDSDQWVASRASGDEPEGVKRLTLDIPIGLHRAIKADCAMRDTKMVTEIVAMLEARWRPEKGGE